MTSDFNLMQRCRELGGYLYTSTAHTHTHTQTFVRRLFNNYSIIYFHLVSVSCFLNGMLLRNCAVGVCQMTNGKMVIKDELRRSAEEAPIGCFRVL